MTRRDGLATAVLGWVALLVAAVGACGSGSDVRAIVAPEPTAVPAGVATTAPLTDTAPSSVPSATPAPRPTATYMPAVAPTSSVSVVPSVPVAPSAPPLRSAPVVRSAPVAPSAPPAPTVSDATSPAVQVANGAEIYQLTCARCHGGNGMGTAQYSGLVGVGSRYSTATMIQELTSGHPVTFGFADRLSSDEIASVVAFVRASFP